MSATAGWPSRELRDGPRAPVPGKRAGDVKARAVPWEQNRDWGCGRVKKLVASGGSPLLTVLSMPRTFLYRSGHFFT